MANVGATQLTLRVVGWFAFVVFFACIGVPGVRNGVRLIPPWEQFGDPSSVAFHALVIAGFALVFAVWQMGEILRAVLLSIVGCAGLLVGLFHLRQGVIAGQFGPDPVAAIVLDTGTLGLVLGSLLLPAALYWRSRATRSMPSRLTVAVGIGVALSVLLLGGLPGTPILGLIDVLRFGAPVDRWSAAAGLVALTAVLMSLLAFLPHPRTGFAALWAFAMTLALGALPVIRSLFIAGYHQGHWKQTLVPLKPSLLFAGGVILFAVGVGFLLAAFERTATQSES